MKTKQLQGDLMSRRDFLKRGVFGALSLAGITMFGSSFLSSCAKDDDENDLAEQEHEIEEEEKKKKNSQS